MKYGVPFSVLSIVTALPHLLYWWPVGKLCREASALVLSMIVGDILLKKEKLPGNCAQKLCSKFISSRTWTMPISDNFSEALFISLSNFFKSSAIIIIDICCWQNLSS